MCRLVLEVSLAPLSVGGLLSQDSESADHGLFPLRQSTGVMRHLKQLLVESTLLPFRIQFCKLGCDFLGVEEENLVGCLVLVAHVVHVESVADI